MIFAVGGGSVIDLAKALSVLSDSSEKSIIECLEGNRDCTSKYYDVVAIPTTAGTGAEVTPFATLWDDKNNWELVGNNKDQNNHSIIGAQQSNAANALVEKLVNSGDVDILKRLKDCSKFIENDFLEVRW